MICLFYYIWTSFLNESISLFLVILRSGFGGDNDDSEDDPQGDDNGNGRFFFSPFEVPGETANASRRCVEACCIFLNYQGDKQNPLWNQALLAVCPNGTVIKRFNSARDLANLPLETLDHLIVATVNKKPKNKTAHHAMVIWKKDNTQLGNTKVELFDPGNLNKTRRTVDLDGRTTADWNRICAAFLLPGTPVFENGTNSESDAIEIMSSSDEESVGDEKPAAKTNDNTKKQATKQTEEDPTSSDEKSDSDEESGGDEKPPAKDGSDNTKNQAVEQTEEDPTSSTSDEEGDDDKKQAAEESKNGNNRSGGRMNDISSLLRTAAASIGRANSDVSSYVDNLENQWLTVEVLRNGEDGQPQNVEFLKDYMPHGLALAVHRLLREGNDNEE